MPKIPRIHNTLPSPQITHPHQCLPIPPTRIHSKSNSSNTPPPCKIGPGCTSTPEGGHSKGTTEQHSLLCLLLTYHLARFAGLSRSQARLLNLACPKPGLSRSNIQAVPAGGPLQVFACSSGSEVALITNCERGRSSRNWVPPLHS